MKCSSTGNNHQQIAMPLCNLQSFSWHTPQQYEFAELCFRRTDLAFGSRHSCISFCCLARVCQWSSDYTQLKIHLQFLKRQFLKDKKVCPQYLQLKPLFQKVSAFFQTRLSVREQKTQPTLPLFLFHRL